LRRRNIEVANLELENIERVSRITTYPALLQTAGHDYLDKHSHCESNLFPSKQLAGQAIRDRVLLCFALDMNAKFPLPRLSFPKLNFYELVA
jgi:hypothetical protein